MFILIRSILFLVMLLVAATVSAVEASGWRTIVDFGCHRLDGTCFVTVDGAAVAGAPTCIQTSIRWDAKNDVNGKTYSH
jgi:hypothetical protein